MTYSEQHLYQVAEDYCEKRMNSFQKNFYAEMDVIMKGFLTRWELSLLRQFDPNYTPEKEPSITLIHELLKYLNKPGRKSLLSFLKGHKYYKD